MSTPSPARQSVHRTQFPAAPDQHASCLPCHRTTLTTSVLPAFIQHFDAVLCSHSPARADLPLREFSGNRTH